MKSLAIVTCETKNKKKQEVRYNVAVGNQRSLIGKTYWMFIKYYYHPKIEKKTIKIRFV